MGALGAFHGLRIKPHPLRGLTSSLGGFGVFQAVGCEAGLAAYSIGKAPRV